MKAHLYKNSKDFLAATQKYMAHNEALFVNILGTLNAIKRRPQLFPKESLWYCTVGTDDEPNAAAISAREPLILIEYFSGDKNDIVNELVNVVAKDFKNIIAARGNKTLAHAFSREWCRSQNVKIKFKMEQRLYRLDKVNDVSLSPGKMRVATMAEKELVLDWFHHFHLDVGGEERKGWEATILPAVEAGWVFFWEDGKPVSMATKTFPTDNGMTVGGVYTPPELRGKGYATSCVAELSRNILGSGKKFCVLTTDLANPTSNSIYIKIGYKPIGDNSFYIFSDK